MKNGITGANRWLSCQKREDGDVERHEKRRNGFLIEPLMEGSAIEREAPHLSPEPTRGVRIQREKRSIPLKFLFFIYVFLASGNARRQYENEPGKPSYRLALFFVPFILKGRQRQEPL